MRWQILILVLLLSACAGHPGLEVETGRHLEAKAVSASIPRPVAAAPLLPKPQPAAKTATYSVVVHQVPVNEILFALGRDAKINVDVHAGVSGNVTLNAINQTLLQILERMSKQVDLRWELENGVLTVTPDIPYFKTYKMNYFNLSRNVKSNVTLANSVSSGTGGGSGNSSNTLIDMAADHHLWKQIDLNLKELLGISADIKSGGVQLGTIVQDQSVQALKSNASAGKKEVIKTAVEAAKVAKDVAQANKINVETEKIKTGESLPVNKASPAVDINSSRLVILNSETGVITVRASQKEHIKVAEYLNAVQGGALRQVLIEATIVEVLLSDQYQAGVDWSRIGETDNQLNFSQKSLANNLGTAPLSVLSYTKVGGILSGTFNFTIKMLEQFGRTRVLSSPKIMALNNQTAVMKVVEEQVYFTVKVTPPVITDGKVTTQATYDSELHTVPIGLVMQVTPQISEDGQVALNVRPTITNINSFVEDPAVAILAATTNTQIKSLVPILQVREFDSTLKVASGQVAILGGLIQDSLNNDRQGVPGLSRMPYLGDLFSYRNDKLSKIELVVFLRPVLIKDAGSDLGNYQQFLPNDQFFKNEADHDLSAFQSGSVPLGTKP
ncbi:pilus (MSHA type) biogenesis protein MshL [Iodobacter ciconiae]|uniref:Type IV pilus biogenesis and competence protein PilQ n=1 Tax=Iodobacter ciconiae TaxID=2496266 RepID=A0A3S8ZUV2_9NEIS|nr:pilus (MSHA type) biogenesis protein MshL [Iodobacter ciconiae]AZN37231.1 pilus (MSHA type) biogenesis protein MshL [Iodobacter ciconiae]